MMYAPKKVLVAQEAGGAPKPAEPAKAADQGHDPQEGRARAGAGRARRGRQARATRSRSSRPSSRRAGPTTPPRSGRSRPRRAARRRRRPRRLARAARRPPRRPQRRRAEHVHAAGRVPGAGSARARDDHGRRPRAQDVGQGVRSHQAADEAGPDGHDQPAARPGDGDDRRRGNGPHGARRQARRSGSLPRRGDARPTPSRSRCRARRS